ncbi:MAG: hypothetical protein SGPRY_009184 [Prymnesium sp.]
MAERTALERRVGGHQRRLYFVLMYCDDNDIGADGVERAIRVLKHWLRHTQNIGLIMAIPEKLSLGVWCRWIGAILFAVGGFEVLPKSKLLRASAAFTSLLHEGIEFSEYRSLMGAARTHPGRGTFAAALHSRAICATRQWMGVKMTRGLTLSCVLFKCLNLVMWPTAFRLREVVRHASGEFVFLTRSCLTCGVIITNPTPAQLQAMREGDFARLAPSRSKPDQWGEIHCPFPVVLTYQEVPGNAANALRELELRCPCVCGDRLTRPLFADAGGAAYTHAFLDRLLKSALAFCFGAKVASLITWHSHCSGLATGLHAAKVDDDMVQLICRWMCPESLHVYRRMGTQEHSRLIQRAMHAKVDLIQSVNVPKVVGDEGYAELVGTLTQGRSTETQKEYEAALDTKNRSGRKQSCASRSGLKSNHA